MAQTVTNNHFIRLVNNRFRFSLFLLYKLPSAWLAGVRVTRLNADSCSTVVPYRWLSQNPFNSTYFACLAMAAEMSSGVLGLAHTQGEGLRVSMLVTGMEGIFLKKAKSRTWFTCDAGAAIRQAVLQTVETGEAAALTISVTGQSEDGTEIARFQITWSFKKV